MAGTNLAIFLNRINSAIKVMNELHQIACIQSCGPKPGEGKVFSCPGKFR